MMMIKPTTPDTTAAMVQPQERRLLFFTLAMSPVFPANVACMYVLVCMHMEFR